MGRVVDLNPEFGYEIACGIPYAYWLHKRGELDKVITSKGMKSFYYFTDDIEEKYDNRQVNNSINGVEKLPNKWIHHNVKAVFPDKDYGDLTDKEKSKVHGVLDYSQWKVPPYKEKYSDDRFKFDKPTVLISNKIVMDHGKEPHNYLDIKTLYELFVYLTEKGYSVLYKRPRMNEFPIDENEKATVHNGFDIKSDVEGIGVIDDHELVKYFDDVSDFDVLVEDYKDEFTYNEIQLRTFSNIDKFISLGGGNSIFLCLFGGELVTYVTTSGECRDGYFDDNSYYRKLGNTNVHAVIDLEKNIIERGYNDYERFINKVKEVF